MEIIISFGERLKEVREALEKSQTEFAEIARAAGVPGATRQSQSLYEKNKQTPSADYLAAIAAAGADVLYILTGVRATAAPVLGAEEARARYLMEALTKEERALLDSYRRATARGKEAMKHVADVVPKSAAAKPDHLHTQEIVYKGINRRRQDRRKPQDQQQP